MKPVTADVDTDWYFAEEIDADWYFAELINRAIETYLKIMPLGNPWHFYGDDHETGWTREDGEAYVATQICRLRDHCRPDRTINPGDRDRILEYRKRLVALAGFVVEEGLSRATFRRALFFELASVEWAAAALETLGSSSRVVKNDHYNRSGNLIAAHLARFGLKHVMAEVVLFLWYCGWKEDATSETSSVEVIDPFTLRTDPGRRGIEKLARSRWSYQDGKGGGKSGGRNQLGFSLARMMSQTRRTRQK